MPLTPQQFVHKWRGVTLKERSAAQEHFLDLCHLIGHPTPAEDDPTGRRRSEDWVADSGNRSVGVPARVGKKCRGLCPGRIYFEQA